jgi:SAM-dependent methyltransferase
MDWTAGYASDIEYTAGFYREQSPSYLNFVCILNGHEPVDLRQPFTYCELGFGRGLTANILAATHPQGRFYATDFNPAHVSGARQLARDAGLSNLTLLENSFAELAEGKADDLPQFDFITLHGIYTWVTAENRRHIADFVARYLKPGGIVYLSYNAMPGWSVSLPLQRLLVEYAELHPGRSATQIKDAAAFVNRIDALGAAWFAANPALKARLETLKTANPNYLVHEYMHKHWQPLYHADVARELAEAKLDFVGSAELQFAYPQLYLSPEKQALLDEIGDRTVKETFKDYFLNTAFRKDVFVRGARTMVAARQSDWLAQIGLALLLPRADIKFIIKTGIGEVNLHEAVYGPACDALAKKPMSLAELAALPALAGESAASIVQMAAFMTVSGQASVYFNHGAGAASAPSLALNKAIAAQVRYTTDYDYLASPLLGNGVPANLIERMVYWALGPKTQASDLSLITGKVWALMRSQGRKMLKDGAALQTDADNLAELGQQVQVIMEQKLPIWRQLKMI